MSSQNSPDELALHNKKVLTALEKHSELEKKLKSLEKQGWLIERAHTEAGRLSGLFFEMETKIREMKVSLRSLQQTEDLVKQLESKYQGASELLTLLANVKAEVQALEKIRTHLASAQAETQTLTDNVQKQGISLGKLENGFNSLQAALIQAENQQSKMTDLLRRWEEMSVGKEPVLRDWEKRFEQISQKQEILQKQSSQWEILSGQALKVQEFADRIDKSLAHYAREKTHLERWEAQLQQLARWREETRLEIKHLEQMATLAQNALDREARLERLVKEADEKINYLRQHLAH